MSITASQLIAEVSTTGVTTAQAQIASMGGAADAASGAMAAVATACATAGDQALAAGAGLGDMAAAITADGEAAMALSDVMAQLDSMFMDQQVAVTSDGEAVVTLGTVMADLAAFADETAIALAAESEAQAQAASTAAYLASTAGGLAPALEATAVAADTTAASANKASLSLDAMGEASKKLALVGLAAGVVAVASLKMAGDFEGATERLVTSAGEQQNALGMVRAGMLRLSIDTGTSTDQLTSAMYRVESSNYHAAAGLQVLAAAAQGAKTENADLTTVSQALLGVLTNYHMPAEQATSAMNGLVAVVKSGATTLQDLSASMAQVLPTAASLGISFAQVGGAIDTMTSKQMPAEQAAQNLAHVLVALSAPSGVAVKSMKAVGLSAQEVKDALAHQGLPEALQMIEEHVGTKFPAGSVQYTTALKNIMGGLVGYKLAAQLTGASLKDTQDHIDAITAAMKNGSGTVDGFTQIQQTFNFQLDQAKAAAEALGIAIGTKLLPILGPLISDVTNAIGKFAAWINSGHAVADALTLTGKYAQITIPILAGLGALVISIIVPAFWAWAAAMIANPIGLIIVGIAAAIALLTAGFIALYNAFPQVRAAVADIGSGFQALGTTVSNVLDAINRNAQESTLQTKLGVLNNTISQKQQVVAMYQQQREQVEQQILQTKDATVKAALEAKLKSIEAAQAQATGVIAAAQKQKAGVQQALEQTDPVVALHALKQKDITVSSSLIQAQQSISNLARQKQGIEQELQGCTDATKRHSLEMQLAATNAAMKQKENVVKQLEQQKTGVETQMKAQAAIVQKDSGGNALISMWQAVSSGVSNAFNAIKTALAPVGQLFSALGTTMQGLWRTIQAQFAPIMAQLGATMKSSLIPAWTSLQSSMHALQPVFDFLGQAMKGLAMVVGGILVVAIGLMVGVLKGAIQAIGAFIAGFIQFVGGIVQVISGVIQVIVGIFTGLFNILGDIFHGNWSKIGSDAMAAWNQIVAGLGNIVGGLWQMILGLFNAGVQGVWGFISGFVTGIIGWFQNLYNTIVGHSIIPDLWKAIVGFFTTGPAQVIGFVQNFVAGLLNHFNQLKSEAIVVFQSLIGQIGNIFSGLGSLASGAMNGALGAIRGGINAIIGAINGFINNLDKIHVSVGGVSIGFSIPDIPYIASGGTIARGGIAVVGEQGPETVWLPPGAQVIPHGQSFGGGGSDQQPIIVNAILQVDGRMMANGLMPHLASAIRQATGVKF